jgi:delta24-sterol reductase
MERHKEAVAVIAATVRHFYDRREPFRIFHGSTNSTRPLSFQRNGMVDTSNLNNVLEIDKKTKTALVEPNVPMDALVQATLAHGLVPPVVMEFPGITVGGGFAGTSGESSSFKYGFFDRIVPWIEMVLANGYVVTASAAENADLFCGAKASFGTLGVTTLLEVGLVDAAGFVELTYTPVKSVEEAVGKLEKAVKDPTLDFVDGIMFAPDEGTICTGTITSSPPPSPTSKIQTFHRPADPWFAVHAARLATLSPSTPVTELVPLQSYLFRYDRGAFWTGVHAFKYFLVPFTAFTRWLLDYFMHTRVMYHALHESGHTDRYILQDCVVPAPNAKDFISYVDNELGIRPLWLCPLRKLEKGERSFHPHAGDDDETMALNVGVWGPGPKDWSAFERVNKGLEQELKRLGGMKWLYAQVFCSEDEFWGRYDRDGYVALRKKWHAESLPSVWEKVRRKERRKRKGWKEVLWRIWPVSGLYGVWKAWKGGDYLVAREREGWLVWGIVLVLGLLLGILALMWIR